MLTESMTAVYAMGISMVLAACLGSPAAETTVVAKLATTTAGGDSTTTTAGVLSATSPDSTTSAPIRPVAFVAACETRIHGAEHDPTIFSSPDAIGPKIAFITISNDNAFRPDLLRPDEGHKFVAVVSAEAVGSIEVVAAPSDAIRLTYDPEIQWPWVFESLYEKVLFEGCDDGTDTQFGGGIVVTGPGCYQLTATDLGTGESHTKQLEMGNECPT